MAAGAPGGTCPNRPGNRGYLGHGVYHATPEELQAIDGAEASGVAADQEVEAVFRTSKDGVGTSAGKDPTERFVFRVTAIDATSPQTVPPPMS